MHGLSLRMVESAFEKSDILHKVRMTLACHTDAELVNCFKVCAYVCAVHWHMLIKMISIYSEVLH